MLKSSDIGSNWKSQSEKNKNVTQKQIFSCQSKNKSRLQKFTKKINLTNFFFKFS